MYNYICILPFLGFKDTPLANFASTSHIFDNVKMLPSKITHLQLALLMLCGCSPSKFCIFNPLKSTIADIVAQHSLLLFTSQLEPIHYLQKIDIRNSSEYGMSVGDTQSVNFCVNEFERTCLKLRSSKFEFIFICLQQKFTLLCVSRSWNLSKNSYINFL